MKKSSRNDVIRLMATTNMTQAGIAKETGVSERTISRWKNEDEEFLTLLNDTTTKAISSAAGKAFGTMVDLLDAKSELVRYNAAKDLLDRGGFAPTNKVDLNSTDIVIKVGDDYDIQD